MTRKTRRIIFYCLIAVFLLATPGVILYADGFSFDFDSWQMTKTGSLYIDSLPQDAKIIINGQEKDLTPSYIGRLKPGRYFIEVTKNGFLAWKKNLDVSQQLTTEARNIILIPRELKIDFIADNVTSTQDYFLTPDQRSVQKKAKTTVAAALNDALSWALDGDSIYFLRASDISLWRTDLDGQAKTQISFEPLPRPATTSPYQIRALGQNIAAFEPGGKLFLFDRDNKAFKQIANEVKGASFSPDNKKLLFWTDKEIWVFWLQDSFIQPYRKPNEKDLITRHSGNIKEAIWLARTNEHIIYTISENGQEDQIKLAELDSRDARNTFDITSIKEAQIYYNQKDGLLYVLSENKLYSLQILEKESFF